MQDFIIEIERARMTGDVEQLTGLLARDVVFRSPVVHTPYVGRNAVAPLLRAVVRVFDEFRFVRVIGGAECGDHALVFRARIGDREIEGCDFLHTTPSGAIDDFCVMVRPLSGAMALAEAMKRELASQHSGNAA